MKFSQKFVSVALICASVVPDQHSPFSLGGKISPMFPIFILRKCERNLRDGKLSLELSRKYAKIGIALLG